ncbi:MULTISPECIES: TetR/AcrR family transcriptional regulator [Enterococcus]|uniref:TetR family transcriptional regulator n=1 Tax=Enterococcus thailandicus TaxID=417368 RepID=A0A179EU85_ENTTH|nr:TetR/AcrR family transcriptional regulator [Enterococcus thailandicus]ASZ06693.1 TetR/AcrR family transcriptional regulator [Enterococcus thailandicus]MDA3966063.1 TetR/AcrR family transcriptional regulator [Enterococcus thailandicus]MDK4352912.1 TetR/AcrR family transcriptional regulator [Enterococcus thailandicus]MDT2734046.1 TetR/AcrR family transcriptional regulator [Enterococcus thailandicus]MDT2751619.1 TetR/AcrR family transcriptional regulator [Enterococcus thailandicus]
MNGFEKRTEEKKKQIVEATFDIINSENGLAGLTIDEVIARTSVSKATVFKYFGNKEALIYQVFFEFMDELKDSAKRIMEQNLSFEETLIKMSENKIDYLKRVDQQFYLDLMAYYTKRNNQQFSEMMDEYTKESLNMMLDLFHRGRKEGKVDLKYSDEFLLLYFQAMIEGISKPAIYSKLLPYTAEWTELLLKGISPNN